MTASLSRRLRTAIDARDMLAAQLSSTRARLVASIAQRDASAGEAQRLQLDLRDLLGESPSPDAVSRAKKARDAAAEKAADQALEADSLRVKAVALDEEHKTRVREAAQVAQSGATALALVRRVRLAAKMAELGSAARDFHAAAFAADRANMVATGSPGEPVAHTSLAACRLMSAPDARDGWVGILREAGLEGDSLKPTSRIALLEEQQILALLENDEPSPDATATNGASQVHEPNEESANA